MGEREINHIATGISLQPRGTLIWRPKSKVIKENKKNRTSPSQPSFSLPLAPCGPAQQASGSPAPYDQVGRFDRSFQETCCFLLFQTFPYSNFDIFINLTPNSILFVSACSLLQIEPFHRPKPLYKPPEPQPFTFSFRSFETLNY